MNVIGKCPECEGDIVEKEKMGYDSQSDDWYEGVIVICEKCGEDFTREIYD